MLDALAKAKEIKHRLRNPVNGHHSSELEIVNDVEIRRRRMKLLRETDAARREVQQRAEIARVVQRAEMQRMPKPRITLSTNQDPGAMTRAPTISSIIVGVSDYYKTPLVEILSRRRDASTVRVRHIAAYLCKTLTSHSLPTIGRHMGDRDHTTILHAVGRIEKMRQCEPGLQAEIDQIKQRLGVE